ncbi:hypothetical protein SeMB42_g07742 [Synchytrium endobioticum]|uniref:Uncharacterized protein n=1 Tax=Synchytrium endobioticum TaxID=286115 RepID=A0A507BQW1_9FUNG|nr:hypothetical protein SeMB42_g07742 [Synchytrium endobioticum]
MSDGDAAYEPGADEEELGGDSTGQPTQLASNDSLGDQLRPQKRPSNSSRLEPVYDHPDNDGNDAGSYSPSKFDDYIDAAASEWKSDEGNNTSAHPHPSAASQPTQHDADRHHQDLPVLKNAAHIPPASILYTPAQISYDGLVRSTRGRIIDSYRPGGTAGSREGEDEHEIEAGEMPRKPTARVVDRYRPSPPRTGRDSYRPGDVNVNSIPVGARKGSHSPPRRRSRSPPSIRPGGDRYRPGQSYNDPSTGTGPPYRDSYRPPRKRSRSPSPLSPSHWSRGPENADRYRPAEPRRGAGRNTRQKIARDDLDNDLDNFIRARPEKQSPSDEPGVVNSSNSKLSSATNEVLAKIVQMARPPPGSQPPPASSGVPRPLPPSRSGSISEDVRDSRDNFMGDAPPRRDSYRPGPLSERGRPYSRGRGAPPPGHGPKPLFTYAPGDPRANIITPPMHTETDFKPDPTLRGHGGRGRGRSERGRSDPPSGRPETSRLGSNGGGEGNRPAADASPNSPMSLNESAVSSGGRYHSDSGRRRSGDPRGRSPSPYRDDGGRYESREYNNRRPASPGTPPKSAPGSRVSDRRKSPVGAVANNRGVNKSTRRSSRWGPRTADELSSSVANAHGDDEGNSQQMLHSSSTSGSGANVHNNNNSSGPPSTGYYGDEDVVDFDEELGSTAQ